MKFPHLPKLIAVKLIELYQKTLSPDHSWLSAKYPHGFCRFYPSCSQYTKESILKFGLMRGSFLGMKRIIRCNPFSKPKVDLTPNS